MTSIGIDARAATEEPAGRGRVVRELLLGLARRRDPHRYLLYARESWPQGLDERFEWRVRTLPDGAWHLWAALDATRRADAFLSTNSYLTAWFTRVPTAVIVYDTVAWDAPGSAQRRAQRIERATAGLGLRRARTAICISQATCQDIVRHFPSVEGKTTVTPLAADDRFSRRLPAETLEAVRARHGLDVDFVLCTGTLEPRKNILRVLDAHGRLDTPAQLALVGPAGWEFEPILERARRREDVRVLGQVSDDDLAALYQACTVFCYPSLYEGFGLPLLEAMAAGAACITSNLSSMPEVGGDAVRYIDPTDVDELAATLEQLMRSPELRRDLGERARARAAGFSWDRTTAQVVEVLDLLVGGVEPTR